jgi:hypothetical protein
MVSKPKYLLVNSLKDIGKWREGMYTHKKKKVLAVLICELQS